MEKWERRDVFRAENARYEENLQGKQSAPHTAWPCPRVGRIETRASVSRPLGSASGTPETSRAIGDDCEPSPNYQQALLDGRQRFCRAQWTCRKIGWANTSRPGRQAPPCTYARTYASRYVSSAVCREVQEFSARSCPAHSCISAPAHSALGLCPDRAGSCSGSSSSAGSKKYFSGRSAEQGSSALRENSRSRSAAPRDHSRPRGKWKTQN